MSERYAVVLDVLAVTTGAGSLDCGVEPPDAGGPVDEPACGDAPELTWMSTATTAANATTLPTIAHTNVRPRRMG